MAHTSRPKSDRDNSPLLAIGAVLFMFSLSATVLGRLAGGFTYEAFWHYNSARVITLAGLLVLGIAVGERAGTMEIRAQVAAASFAVVLVMALAIPAMRLMEQGIYWRFDTWMDGPARISVVRDIEPESGWVIRCWERLIDRRDDGGRRYETEPASGVTVNLVAPVYVLSAQYTSSSESPTGSRGRVIL